MIQLDANYLILGTQSGTAENADLHRWIAAGEPLAASAIAWMEFVSAPVKPELVTKTRAMLEERIIPIGREEAERGAELFHLSGRKRALRYGCLIAATAIQSGARLATANKADFQPLLAYGLELA